jgi:hypothetical protein
VEVPGCRAGAPSTSMRQRNGAPVASALNPTSQGTTSGFGVWRHPPNFSCLKFLVPGFGFSGFCQAQKLNSIRITKHAIQ